jgi:K+ transporter
VVLAALGIFDASLFFGDGMITPAISVLSAVEGLKTVDPGLAGLVVPITAVIIIVLFILQITVVRLVLTSRIVRAQAARSDRRNPTCRDSF